MKKIIIIFITVILSNCTIHDKSSTKTIVVDLEKEINDKSQPKIEIINKIFLETDKKSVFNDIAQLEIFQDILYIHEVDPERRLFLFDKYGKYITSNKTGKGPGEVINVSAFYLDRKLQNINIWDQEQQKLNTFDLKLNYKSSRSIQNKYTYTQIDQIDQINDSLLLAFKNTEVEYGGIVFSYYIFSNMFEKINAFLPISKNNASYYTYDSFSREEYTKRLLSRAFDNTIYELNGINEILPRYYFDFGNYNLLKDDADKGIYHSVELYSKGEVVLGFQNLIHTNEYITFNFGFKNNYENYVIYNTIEDKVITSSELVSLGLVPKGKIVDFDQDCFVLSVQPSNYNEYLSISDHHGTKLDLVSNPLLLYIKFL